MEPPAAFQERSTSRLAEIGRVWGPWLAYRLMVLLVWWTVLYCLPLIGVTIAPGGTGFALGLLYGVSVLGSFLIKKVAAGVPALLGMLLAGLMLRNGHVAVFDEPYLTGQDPLLGHTFEWWSLTLRSWALSIIMLRAGLGLDLDKLKTMGAVTARLACGPCLAEAATVALFAGPLLGLPPAWGGLLGFVIAAVSPAVVVPGMLDMQTRRLGTKKGVPSMVIAAASFDDVLAIAGFGICLALALPDVAKESLHPFPPPPARDPCKHVLFRSRIGGLHSLRHPPRGLEPARPHCLCQGRRRARRARSPPRPLTLHPPPAAPSL